MDIEKQLITLGLKLGEIAARNTAATIATKINTAKTKKKNEEVVQELEEIISALISDRNELVQIAQSYKQELVAQQISNEDIEYITTKFIPVLQGLLKQTSSDNATIQKTLDALAPLLSIETLTVLQLLGFNYKKAIGEPLTLLMRQTIISNLPINGDRLKPQ